MFSQIRIGLLALTMLYMLSSAVSASTNLVVNGSFEGATTTDQTTGDVLPVGWTLGPPSPASLSKVNVDNSINAAVDLGPEDGTHYARFQSPAANGTRDCLYQDINTVPGQLYAVSFWVAATSTSVGNNSGLGPEWDESSANPTELGTNQFYFFPTNTGPVPYQFFSFMEVASSNLTRLDFHGIDQNGSILLDNVSVTPLIRGDINLDNHVNAADITSMSAALANSNSYEKLKGLNDSELSYLGDINQDGKFNNADLQGIINYLKSGNGSLVPEPANIVLASAGLAALLRMRRQAAAQ